MDYSKIEHNEGESVIWFTPFDPENPPPSGHYLIRAKDKMMNFDVISMDGTWGGSVMYGCDYQVEAYSKITLIIDGSH